MKKSKKRLLITSGIFIGIPVIAGGLYVLYAYCWLTGCGMSSTTEEEKEARKNPSDEVLLNEKVHYLIDGRRFDVPLGYHQWQKMKYGYWPHPKEEYTEVISTKMIDAVLPDMRPYLQSTRKQFDERIGHGDVITILIQSRTQRIKPIPEILSDFYQLAGDQSLRAVPGLIRYVRKANSPENSDSDTYVLEEPGVDGAFIMHCDLPTERESPGCRVAEFRPEYPGPLSLGYDFSRKYLPQWAEIRRDVWSLIANFENTQDKKGE